MVFNLQGTSHRRSDLSILTHNFSFVKNFFQILSNFFSVLRFFARALKRSHIISNVSPIVKHFFVFFTTFFSKLQIVVFPVLTPLNMREISLPPVQTAQAIYFCPRLSTGFMRRSLYLLVINLFRNNFGSKGNRYRTPRLWRLAK